MSALIARAQTADLPHQVERALANGVTPAELSEIVTHVAFYAGAMDACFVDGERVVPQPGGFYGGWITSTVAGPFKSLPGSRLW